MDIKRYMYRNHYWRSAQKALIKFKPDVTWSDLNKSFILEFKEFMLNDSLNQRNQHYSVNTFIKYYQCITEAVNRAYGDGVIKRINTSCLGIKFQKEEVEHVYLTMNELKKIENIKLEPNYDIIRRMFLIGAYSGARFSDFKEFKKESIHDGLIRYRSRKTGRLIAVPAHEYVVQNISKGMPRMKNIKESAQTAVFNQRIKKICERAGINDIIYMSSRKAGEITMDKKKKYQLVGSHTARRSFATNLLLSGANIKSIQSFLGHSSIITTENYIKAGAIEIAEKEKDLDFFYF